MLQLRLRWAALYLAAPLAYFAVPGTGTGAAIVYFWSALATAIALLVLAWHRGVPFKALGLDAKVRWQDLVWGVGGFVAASPLWPLAETIIQAAGSTMFWGDAAPSRAPLSSPLLVAYYVGVLVAVPFAEEIWFRGYAIGALRERGTSAWLTVAAVSVTFAAFHLYGGPGFALFVLCWSLIASSLFVWTNRLWPSLVMHILNNVFAHVVVPLVFVE